MKKQIKDYGNQINRTALLDLFLKPKNWIISRLQYRILNHFGKFPVTSGYARCFSSLARRMVGGYIYSLKLEVNDYCDLNCKMCYIHKGKQELPFSVITRLLDQIRSYRIRLEILGGEPLLRQDIVDIIRYAKNRSRVPFISLYTNGIQATADLARELKAAGLNAAIVTLISQRPEVHDMFTGHRGSWAKTLAGIDNLKAAGLEVYTFTAIHRYNYQDYREIYNFVKNTLQIHALFYQYIPQKNHDDLVIDPRIWGQIKHWILVEKNKLQQEFVTKFYMLTGNACSGGNFVLTIKANGSVQPCPFMTDLSLGNIFHNDIWSIYKNRFNHPELVQFKSVPVECARCSYQSVCGGGCKVGNKALDSDYGHRDFRCLGPYSESLQKERVTDCVPTFF
jgi:radical SAM protein with 4Fe4S-binding SPASM domain